MASHKIDRCNYYNRAGYANYEYNISSLISLNIIFNLMNYKISAHGRLYDNRLVFFFYLSLFLNSFLMFFIFSALNRAPFRRAPSNYDKCMCFVCICVNLTNAQDILSFIYFFFKFHCNFFQFLNNKYNHC